MRHFYPSLLISLTSPGLSRPYLIDLESTHGTFLNGKKIEPSRFIQLLPKDVIRFAASTREYVFLVEE